MTNKIMKINDNRRQVYYSKNITTYNAVLNATNLMVIGDNEDLRIYLITDYLATLNETGVPFILIHSSPRFANIFKNGELKLPVQYINYESVNYDPFYDMDPKVIGNMVIKLSKNNDPAILLIIKLYCDLILSQSKLICLEEILELSDKSVGELTKLAQQAEVSNQSMSLVANQTLRVCVHGTLLQLQQQLQHLWKSGSEKTNIYQSITSKKSICINLANQDHRLIEEIMAAEINELMSINKKIVMTIEGISITSESLYQLLNSNSPNLIRAISGGRLNSMVGTEIISQGAGIDRLIGNFDRIIILHHSTAQDCECFCQAFGTYRFINKVTSSGVNRLPFQIFRGHHDEQTLSEEDRQRLRFEDISSLSKEGAFIYYGNTGIIEETEIIT